MHWPWHPRPAARTPSLAPLKGRPSVRRDAPKRGRPLGPVTPSPVQEGGTQREGAQTHDGKKPACCGPTWLGSRPWAPGAVLKVQPRNFIFTFGLTQKDPEGPRQGGSNKAISSYEQQHTLQSRPHTEADTCTRMHTRSHTGAGHIRAGSQSHRCSTHGHTGAGAHVVTQAGADVVTQVQHTCS